MNGVEPVESDVGEREIIREKEASVSRDAGQSRRMRAQRSPIRCTAHPLATYWLLAHAPLAAAAAAALNASHISSLFARCRRIH